MTAVEMQDLFQSKLSKFDDLKGIQYTSKEVSKFLTEAQNHLVNVHTLRFQYDELSKKFLHFLTKPSEPDYTAYQTPHYPNSTLWKLPSDVKAVVQEFTTDGIVKPVNLSYYNRNINNPFKKPNVELDWRLDFNPVTIYDNVHHILISDATKAGTLNTGYYHIIYIKIPNDIDIDNSVNSELHIQLHKEIVNLAVDLAINESKKRIDLMQESLPLQTSKNE